MNVIFQAFFSSDFFGKLIFSGLFFLSVITWVVLLQKYFQYKNVRNGGNKLQDLLAKAGNNVLSVELANLTDDPEDSNSSNPFLSILSSIKNKTVEILDKNHFFHNKTVLEKSQSVFLSRADLEHLEARAHTAMSNEAKRLEKNLFILSTIVPLAPFLGILGTVWGILISLGEMQKGTMAHSNSIVLGGLSTALATTVLGLVIAIPALIAYNYLRNQLKDVYIDMEDFSGLLLSNIELQYRKVDGT